MTTTTTTAIDYPPLPTLPPCGATESVEAYGLRALQFIVTTDVTATVPTEALELASHCYRVAIDNRDLTPATIDRLAQADRLVAATLRARARIDAEAAIAAPAAAVPPTIDKPRLGPMAPLSPRPKAPTGPARATVPARVRVPEWQAADAF